MLKTLEQNELLNACHASGVPGLIDLSPLVPCIPLHDLEAINASTRAVSACEFLLIYVALLDHHRAFIHQTMDSLKQMLPEKFGWWRTRDTTKSVHAFNQLLRDALDELSNDGQ